jgi:hypothetical protein
MKGRGSATLLVEAESRVKADMTGRPIIQLKVTGRLGRGCSRLPQSQDKAYGEKPQLLLVVVTIETLSRAQLILRPVVNEQWR